MSVPPANVEPLMALARAEEVEATAIGHFTDTGRLVVRFDGTVVGDLEMSLLHDGLPKIERVAEWQPALGAVALEPDVNEPANFSHESDVVGRRERGEPVVDEFNDDIGKMIDRSLSDLNACSKHWVIRQFDHEVRSGTVIKPLVGHGEGPADAAVLRPRLDSRRGVVVGCGMAPHLGDVDPYWMAIASIDEAVRNCVSVGGDPENMAILDNFCWPSSENSHALGALVRTCQACYDAAKVYGLPFVSGKDSLNNVFSMNADDAAQVRRTVKSRYANQLGVLDQQFARQPNRLGIPYTLLISALSVIENIDRCIHTAVPLEDGASTHVLYVGLDYADWGGVRLPELAELHKAVHAVIADGVAIAAHDVSDGGPIGALAEMAVASDCTLELVHESLTGKVDPNAPHFGYMLALEPAVAASMAPIDVLAQFAARFPSARADVVARLINPGTNQAAVICQTANAAAHNIGADADMTVDAARGSWRRPLDW